MSDSSDKKPIDVLVNELADATKKAQDLAVEVKESLRKSRRAGTMIPKDTDRQP